MICYINDNAFRRLSISDPLIYSGLSSRVCKVLINENIHTIQDLLLSGRQELVNIQGLGQKGLNELFDFLGHLRSHPIGHRIYPLTAERAALLGIEASVNFEAKRQTIISPKIKDTSLENLPLSVRAYNSLHSAGHRTVGDVFKLSRKDLLRIRNLGTGTADEIIEVIDQFIEKNSERKQFVHTISSSAANACQCFMRSLFLNSTIYDMKLYREILREFREADEQGRAVNYAMLYQNEQLRAAAGDKIIQTLNSFPFGLSRDVLFNMLPAGFMLPAESFDSILSEMQQMGVVRIQGKISIRRMSITDLLHLIEEDRLKDMLIKRLRGVPLKAIAGEYGISKERVRQVVLNGIQKMNIRLEEEKYIPVFEKYLFTKDEFMQAFGEPAETFHYLTIVCNKTKQLPISKFTGDLTLPDEIIQGIRNLFSLDFIYIDGEKIEHSRVSLTKFVVRTRFQSDISFDELVETYNTVLKSHDLGNDPKLTMNTRSYINHLRRADFLLWKPGYILRYYDINSRNYDELLNTLQLDRYHNVEYSVRKFFLAEPDLMEKYDIRCEHELHNLLRKVCEKQKIKGIKFLRTPNVSFGKSDRYQQVYELLLAHSPISQREFLVKYGEIYGPDPLNTNPVFYLGSFREYCNNGVYDVRDTSQGVKREGTASPSLRPDIPLSQSDC